MNPWSGLKAPSPSGRCWRDERFVAPKPRWGIVGPGEIAHVFARALAKYDLGTVAAVYGRDPNRREAFCREFGGRPADSLDGLLQPGEVDVVYVATPHPAHTEVVEGALERGIAVLCEKPMTVAPPETCSLIDLAHRKSTLLVEGWMYRFHPQIEALVALLKDRTIGEVHQVVASFGVSCADHLPERILAPALGGGSILDIGGYPASAACSSIASSVGTVGSRILMFRQRCDRTGMSNSIPKPRFDLIRDSEPSCSVRFIAIWGSDFGSMAAKAPLSFHLSFFRKVAVMAGRGSST